MENSIGSSMLDSFSCGERNDYPEESGWTYYLGDQGSMDTEKSDSYSDFRSTSSISDVVSGSFKHPFDKFLVDSEKIPKKLSFKKKFDEELEDTACSPNNSPKVTYFKQFNTQPTNKDKGNASGFYSNLQGTERRQLGFTIGNGNEITELNKRGLCVVPLSAFRNYQG
ncbi:hypothetical protein ACHQM5_003678 [Ranunculus cassubicifolius]